MGRYCYGDIEHKFMFGIQSSDAADRFGVCGTESNDINYYFTDTDLPEVEKELERIKVGLGSRFKAIDEKYHNSNSNAVITKHEWSEYADYILGVKIRDCIVEKGQCDFDAEC